MVPVCSLHPHLVSPGCRPQPAWAIGIGGSPGLGRRRAQPRGPGQFFEGFEEQHAVQYFYEPFLEAYDPELRKELGVWYTPLEIVKYQVARVDRVLREELDLADGLADPNVIVLDPCCGTGAYLVEVLHRIAATLRDKGGDALVASDLKQAAMNRVFGFEILPAPFVVSHLQLGLMLQTQGAPLSQKKGERVGVYLTNALTGWEPPKGPKQRVMPWAELQEERDAAEHVKRDKKIPGGARQPALQRLFRRQPPRGTRTSRTLQRWIEQRCGWGIKAITSTICMFVSSALPSGELAK